MNEIWPMEKGWYCIYSEDVQLCQHLARLKKSDWFGTYTKGDRWIAEQYRFPKENYNTIAKRAGLLGH